jgi:nucleoside-diphosphate-sugar epimerase
MIKQISILGCGWLGFPLAKSLTENGFSINGSTTSVNKISILTDAKINAFLLEISEDIINGDIYSFLENSEILIIDIPPKLRGNSNENFVSKIEQLIPFIEKSTVKKVIFISSTSVYPDHNSIISEETTPQPESDSGKQLWETEQLLKKNIHFKTTIVRFGGLIGTDRHPIYFLAGKQNVENPDAPINLIHQTDCIGIINQIITSDCFGETFNAVAPFHPSRKEYYSQKAIALQLIIPEFLIEKPSYGKNISSKKIETVLNYNYKYKTL